MTRFQVRTARKRAEHAPPLPLPFHSPTRGRGERGTTRRRCGLLLLLFHRLQLLLLMQRLPLLPLGRLLLPLLSLQREGCEGAKRRRVDDLACQNRQRQRWRSSARIPGRTPWKWSRLPPRRIVRCSCSTSLVLLTVFWLHGAPFCCAPWCVAAASATATLSCAPTSTSQRRCHRVQLASTARVFVEGAHADKTLLRKTACGCRGCRCCCRCFRHGLK